MIRASTVTAGAGGGITGDAAGAIETELDRLVRRGESSERIDALPGRSSAGPADPQRARRSM